MTDHGGQSHRPNPDSWTRKLGSDAKRLITADQPVSHQESGETDALVRTSRELSTADRARLESIGATVRTVAGDVVTTSIPIRRLEALARLDFVVYVELSRPLGQERRGHKGEGG